TCPPAADPARLTTTEYSTGSPRVPFSHPGMVTRAAEVSLWGYRVSEKGHGADRRSITRLSARIAPEGSGARAGWFGWRATTSAAPTRTAASRVSTSGEPGPRPTTVICAVG